MVHSARGAQRHATRNTRREARDRRRSSFMHPPEPPVHAADLTITDPPNLPYPTRRCEERERAPRSSTCTMLPSSSRLPARSQASSVRSCGSAQPSRRSSAMFCTMFTASPPATGSAALAAINAVSEQPGHERRVENGMEMDHLHAIFASHSSRLQPSLCLPAPAPQRPV